LTIHFVYLSLNVTTLHLTRIFFFNATATTPIYTLSLHDALPISHHLCKLLLTPLKSSLTESCSAARAYSSDDENRLTITNRGKRSEEHTSELQSPYDLVCRLLLEKKKKKKKKKKK